MKSLTESKTIGIVNLGAPEPLIFRDKFEKGLDFLRSRGYKIILAENVFSDDGFFNGGKPSEQAEGLHSVLKNTEVDFVICAGGGNVANNILPYLDFALIKKSDKAILGMSIVSGILNSITHITSLTTFHGPVIIWNFGDDKGLGEYSFDSIKNVTNSRNQRHIYLPRNNETKWEVLREGEGFGTLYGGNLGVIQRLIGTKFEPKLEGSILFIEDCFKNYGLIAEMLYHFKNSGRLAKLQGLIVGEFFECNPGDLKGKETLGEVVLEICKEFDFPILNKVELGHTTEKITLPIGANASLNLSPSDCQFSVTWR
ncbi:MAG: LD-carboxypeptidase [Ignavibacteria bacterium]|nr:LD-carboxypeptidase [Ignavibacteria bacterium]